jgi:hypothetical protein
VGPPPLGNVLVLWALLEWSQHSTYHLLGGNAIILSPSYPTLKTWQLPYFFFPLVIGTTKQRKEVSIAKQ